jgi:hypothetical protein
MATGIATQLITVAATLSGVVLTLVANAYREGRRAQDVRELPESTGLIAAKQAPCSRHRATL